MPFLASCRQLLLDDCCGASLRDCVLRAGLNTRFPSPACEWGLEEPTPSLPLLPWIAPASSLALLQVSVQSSTQDFLFSFFPSSTCHKAKLSAACSGRTVYIWVHLSQDAMAERLAKPPCMLGCWLLGRAITVGWGRLHLGVPTLSISLDVSVYQHLLHTHTWQLTFGNCLGGGS